jgi:hypothetical protein
VVTSAAKTIDASDIDCIVLGGTSRIVAPAKGSMFCGTGEDAPPACEICMYGVWAADATNARVCTIASLHAISDCILMTRTMDQCPGSTSIQLRRQSCSNEADMDSVLVKERTRFAS